MDHKTFGFIFVLFAVITSAFAVSCPPDGQHFFPHPTRCNKFIECNDGVVHEQTCFGDLIFNPDVGYCDFPENYPCEDKLDEPIGNCPPINNINSYFLQNSGNCESFYLCSWGEPILMQCPLGTQFNPTHWVCDLPEQAGCTVETKY